MGHEGDDPKPGFDHWVSFRGQGNYLPAPDGLNVNGKRVPQKGYITDELTDYAVEWLEGLSGDQPFFLYLSHKAVHADFTPAERHAGRYRDRAIEPPPTMAPPARERPLAGVDPEPAEQLARGGLPVPQPPGRLGVLPPLPRDPPRRRRQRGAGGGAPPASAAGSTTPSSCTWATTASPSASTASSTSAPPTRSRCGSRCWPGSRGCRAERWSRRSWPTSTSPPRSSRPRASSRRRGSTGGACCPCCAEADAPWRSELLYEYFWERNFPQTPTVHALRGDRYKYIRYHGLWDVDELFDLQEDPLESRNLIASPEHQEIVAEMNRRLFEILEETGGMSIPLAEDRGRQNGLRRPDLAAPALFPEPLIAPEDAEVDQTCEYDVGRRVRLERFERISGSE